MAQFVVDVWGPRACFTPPYAKVERLSLSVPTPSALRGILSAIYCKPAEFYWTIDQIEVMNPIRFQSCKRNELKSKMSGAKPIDADAVTTQRVMTMLVDVYYRITATMHPRKLDAKFETQLVNQMNRRLSHGQCFFQPCLGIRECECYFAPADVNSDKKPIPVTQDFGLMTFDTHVPGLNTPGQVDLSLSLYHCTMIDGVIQVPDYDSPEVLKIGGYTGFGCDVDSSGEKRGG